MKRRRRLGFCFLTACALCCALTAPAAIAKPETQAAPSAAAPPTVSVRNDKVTLKADDVEVETVVAAIAKEAGATVQGTASKRRVTMEIDGIPMKEALQRVLGEQNFTLTYAHDSLKVIQLKNDAEDKLRRSNTASNANDVTVKGDPSDWAPKGWWKMTRMFDGKRIPIDRSVQRSAEGDTVSWDWLVQGAYVMRDANARQDLVRRGVKAFEADKELRDGVLAATESMSDDEIARFVRAFCRDRGAKFVRAIAITANDDELKSRARAVALRIREIDRSGEPLPFGKMPPDAH